MSKNTPLLQLMHDAVGPANRIKKLSELIRKEPTLEQKLKMLDMIEKSSDDINVALDTYYKYEVNRPKFDDEGFQKLPNLKLKK